MILQHVLCVNLHDTISLLLIEDMVVDELLLVLLVDDLIRLALGKCGVDILDGFKANGFGLLGEVQEELLGLHVH